MQLNRKRLTATALISFAMVALAPGAKAQTLTVPLNTHAVNFALTRGSATNAAAISWFPPQPGPEWAAAKTLRSTATSPMLRLALTGPGGNIPSSALSISVNGTAFRDITFTEPTGGANAGRHIVFDIPINNNGTRTDSTVFNMDISTGTLPQLPPGTYTGTLSVRAQII